jgi:TRAP-type C4-dicarboxylate transport system permease small subunit
VRTFREIVRRLVRLCDHAAGWFLIAICALNLAAVFMRYGVGNSISWSEEGIRYLAIWMTFFGAAVASWYDEHLDMNVFAGWGGDAFQAWHRGVLNVLTAIFAGFVLWQGVDYLRRSGMQTAPTTGIRMYWVYGAIALGGLLLLVISIAKIWDSIDPPAEIEAGERGQLM